MKRLFSALAVLATAVSLTSCGSDDDSGGDSPSGDPTLEDGTSLSMSIEGVYTNEGLVDYEIGDDEIRIELDQGSASDDESLICSTSINPELIDGRPIVFVFPDGEVTCEY